MLASDSAPAVCALMSLSRADLSGPGGVPTMEGGRQDPPSCSLYTVPTHYATHLCGLHSKRYGNITKPTLSIYKCSSEKEDPFLSTLAMHL